MLGLEPYSIILPENSYLGDASVKDADTYERFMGMLGGASRLFLLINNKAHVRKHTRILWKVL